MSRQGLEVLNLGHHDTSRSNYSKKVLAWLAALALVGFSISPQAAMEVPLNEVAFISGTDISVFEFEITTVSPGGFTATLTDFEFPSPFSTLAMIITSATESFGSLTGPGSFSFSADPGTYFASVVGVASGALDLGLFGVEVASIETVPLPPAIWLMGAAVAALVSVKRLETRQKS